MCAISLIDIRDATKRIVNANVLSDAGLTDTELLYYLDDSLGYIQMDYPDFTVFTINLITSGITPEPDVIDKALMSIKAAQLISFDLGAERIGDAVMIRAGSITLDTSKSLRAHGIEFDRLDKMYDDLVQNLNMNGKSTETNVLGSRVDNYIQYDGDTKSSDALN
jgi:hypothetical protein